MSDIGRDVDVGRAKRRKVDWGFTGFAGSCAFCLAWAWLGTSPIPTWTGLAFISAPFVVTAALAAALASWLVKPRASKGPWSKRPRPSWLAWLLAGLLYAAGIGPAMLLHLSFASGSEYIAEGGSFIGYWISTFIVAVIPAVVASVIGGAFFFFITQAVDRPSSGVQRHKL